jgi:transaldolase
LSARALGGRAGKTRAPTQTRSWPERTLRAFAEHGTVEVTLGPDLDAAGALLGAAAAAGVDLDRIAPELGHDGIRASCDS